MSQRRLSLQDNGGAYVSDMGEKLLVYITPDEVRQLSEHYELVNTIEDVKSRLEERRVYREGEKVYDKEKYTHTVIRNIAKRFVQQKSGNESIMESYWVIMDYVIDQHDKGEK